jgi:hypothetical protein
VPRRLAYLETDRKPGGATNERGRWIRCPKCKWRPDKKARWQCVCGHVWNTFDTRGVCPSCDAAWANTRCPKCREWSPHEDWYGDDEPSSSSP